MNALIFVDTNILVHAHDSREPLKQDRATSLMRMLESVGAAVSSQVLGEFFSTAVRDSGLAMPLATAERHTRTFGRAFTVLNHGLPVVIEAIRGAALYRMHFYDAQIWAVARLNCVPLVLSEDFVSGSEIEGVRFANPFSEGFDLATELERTKTR